VKEIEAELCEQAGPTEKVNSSNNESTPSK